MLSRRDLLIIAPGSCLGLLSRASAAARWLDRNPNEWTPADVQDVLDRSAWIREVTLNSNPSAREQARGEKERRPSLSEFKVVVRWESGLPIRLARRLTSLPDKGVDRYVISVSRLPVEYIAASSALKSTEAAEAAIAAQLAGSCSIDRDGKESIRAERAYWVCSDFSQRLDLVFPRQKNLVRYEDWEATVSGRVGEFLLRARFSLKQMVYRGLLEV